MEKSSLYDLMNIKLGELNLGDEYNDLKKFITDDKRSIKFIKYLTEGFEADEIDEKVFQVVQTRARHSVITFLMGMVFSEFKSIYNSIGNTVEVNNNLTLWLLTSLNHDQGYYSKYLQDGNIEYKKIFKFYLFEDLYNEEELHCLSNFQENYPHVSAYTYDEIMIYDDYARQYHKKSKDLFEKIDHGILGGLITYNRLIKEHLNVKSEDSMLRIIKAASLSIAQHNIFKSPTKETDKLYPQELICKLGSQSKFKIGMNTPLLLLLSLVDTLECVKRFGKSNRVNGQYLETLTILKNIYLKVSDEEIELDFSSFNSIVSSKGFFEDYINKYQRGIYSLKKWTDLIVEKKGSTFKITL